MLPLIAGLVLAAPPAARLNAFGLALMRARAESKDNDLFSPISASAALALLFSASSGRTEAELSHAMDLGDLTQQGAEASVGELLKSLTDTPDKEVTIANAIFAPPAMELADAFVRDVKSTFGARVERLQTTGRGGVDQVNRWAAEATKDRIPHLLDTLTPGAAVLANAVTFDGKWMTPFQARSTHDEVFHGLGGDRSVPMMHRTGFMVYRDLSDRREVELPYYGEQFLMRVMLPKGDDPRSVLDALPVAPPGQTLRTRVDLTLPRFSFAAQTDLRVALGKVGLSGLFVHVDLRRMSPGGPPTRVSQVFQKAWIAVDEAGTKAAAATTIITPTAILGGRRPVEFRVDRPFAFTIEDRIHGLVLFAGTVWKLPRG